MDLKRERERERVIVKIKIKRAQVRRVPKECVNT